MSLAPRKPCSIYSRVLTCPAPQCQELPLRVIYQSHSLIAKNLLFGRRCAPHRLFSAGNTVPLPGTPPFGRATALSGQWPEDPPAYSRAPPVL
ncbi:hypothetical protein KXX35_009503, partial [Aspergillus fumigatus]